MYIYICICIIHVYIYTPPHIYPTYIYISLRCWNTSGHSDLSQGTGRAEGKVGAADGCQKGHASAVSERRKAEWRRSIMEIELQGYEIWMDMDDKYHIIVIVNIYIYINYRTKMGNVRKMGENRIIEQQRSDRNYRTKMGNVRKMGENRIIEQQRSDKNYRTGPGKH